jgi:NAD(P)-dependent dehydrogenase (short-subunit alcohol dehydrogenase family)
MELRNKAVLITGGTRGLGLGLAQAFQERGARVGIVGQHIGRLEEIAAQLGVLAIRADVGDKEAIHRIVGQAQAALGPIDIVLHNASTLGATPLRGLLDSDCEDLERVLAVNLVGPFRLSKALAAGMLVRGEGALVHVSSDAALENYPGWGAYGVSKAALDHLSRQWAIELPQLRVLSIDPGEMNTDMHRDALPDADPSTLASPSAVAQKVVRILEDAKYVSGSRVRAAEVA